MNAKLRKFVPLLGVTLMFSAHCVQASSTNLITATFDYGGDTVGAFPSSANGGPSGVGDLDGASSSSFITNGIVGGGFSGQSLASFSGSNVGAAGQAIADLRWDTGGTAGLNYTYVTNKFGTDKQFLRASVDAIVTSPGQITYGFNSADNFRIITLVNFAEGTNRYWRAISEPGAGTGRTTNTFGTWNYGVAQNVLLEVDLLNRWYRLDIDGVYGPHTYLVSNSAYIAQSATPVNAKGFGRFLIMNDRQVNTDYSDNYQVQIWSSEIPEPTSVTLLAMAGFFLASRRFFRRSS